MVKVLIICLFTISFNCFSGEVDSFSVDAPLKDGYFLVNKKFNYFIKKAVVKLDRESKGCNENDLYKYIRTAVGTKFVAFNLKEVRGQDGGSELLVSAEKVGDFITYLFVDKELDNSRYIVDIDKSIFKNNSSPIFSLSDIFGVSVLSPNIRFGNYLIGIDKFQHLLGWISNSYFEDYILLKDGDELPWKDWISPEINLNGLLTTGVYSYGDLSANFNGMRFWNSLLLQKPDVLELIKEPHVKCIDNKWELVKFFNLKDFIDISFDERINRSLYSLKFNGQKSIDNILEYTEDVNSTFDDNGIYTADYKHLRLVLEKYNKIKDWHYLLNIAGNLVYK